MSCSSRSQTLWADWSRNLLDNSLDIIALSALSLPRGYASGYTSYLANVSSVTSACNFLKKTVLLSSTFTSPWPSVTRFSMVTLRMATKGVVFLCQACWDEWPFTCEDVSLPVIANGVGLCTRQHKLENIKYTYLQWSYNTRIEYQFYFSSERLQQRIFIKQFFLLW